MSKDSIFTAFAQIHVVDFLKELKAIKKHFTTYHQRSNSNSYENLHKIPIEIKIKKWISQKQLKMIINRVGGDIINI